MLMLSTWSNSLCSCMLFYQTVQPHYSIPVLVFSIWSNSLCSCTLFSQTVQPHYRILVLVFSIWSNNLCACVSICKYMYVYRPSHIIHICVYIYTELLVSICMGTHMPKKHARTYAKDALLHFTLIPKCAQLNCSTLYVDIG